MTSNKLKRANRKAALMMMMLMEVLKRSSSESRSSNSFEIFGISSVPRAGDWRWTMWTILVSRPDQRVGLNGMESLPVARPLLYYSEPSRPPPSRMVVYSSTHAGKDRSEQHVKPQSTDIYCTAAYLYTQQCSVACTFLLKLMDVFPFLLKTKKIFNARL